MNPPLIKPDNNAALEFLRLFEPEGPWILTAIRPDPKVIQTRTFWPGDDSALRGWLNDHNGTSNLYFHVNRPSRDLNKKAERKDIKEIRWLHVDIDPRAGEDIDTERSRIFSLLTDRLPASFPAPTVIIFSGGGYQALWRLAEPIPINGELAAAEDAKRYNQQLEILFGGDNCHNIDRILRLPGTINIPDERKRKKGRQPMLAKLVHYEPASYSIAAFTPAPPPHADQTTALGRPGQFSDSISISGNIARLAGVEDLNQWNVSDRVKVIVVQGHDPDHPKEGDNSRSAWVFDAACHLVRDGVPDDVIFAILTDPEFSISESILEKGCNAERYAIRQIERAKDEVIDPWLRRLNEQHFVIENEGGKCRVAEWVPANGDGREQLSFQSFEDFRNRYMNSLVHVGVDKQGQAVRSPAGRWWLSHPNRRQFRGMVFRPGRGNVINGFLNLWRGFGVEGSPGDWSRMKAHILETLADGIEPCAEYIMRWAAWAVQNPDQPAEVALVFKGGQGTGKGTFARAMTALFGQHGLQVTAAAQFAGRFNAHLRDVCLLFADEAVRPDDRASRGILKALLTEKNLPVEGKGRDIVQAPNYTKVIMASNEEWVVPVEIGDRRFAVFEVSERHKQDEEYFRALNVELEGGGLAAMLHELLTTSLGDWHPRRGIPQTKARDEQKAASLTGFAAVFLDLLRVGEIPALRFVGDGKPFVATSTLAEFARRHLRRDDVTFNQVSELLRTLGFEKARERPRGFILPPLCDARAAWDKKMLPVRWDETRDWAPIPNAGVDSPF